MLSNYTCQLLFLDCTIILEAADFQNQEFYVVLMNQKSIRFQHLDQTSIRSEKSKKKISPQLTHELNICQIIFFPHILVFPFGCRFVQWIYMKTPQEPDPTCHLNSWVSHFNVCVHEIGVLAIEHSDTSFR